MPPPDPILNRREALKAGAALAALPLLARCSGRAPGTRPNVLFVLSDSHRARTTGCYGDTDIATPNFDRFAKSGLKLDTAVSNTPLCKPYRASLMAGSYSQHTGLLTNASERNFGVKKGTRWSPGDLPTLGQTFTRAGYRCGYVGKWHLGNANCPAGDRRLGFDDYWAVSIKDAHDYYNWTYVTDHHVIVTGQGHFRPTMETDLAIDFIRDSPTDEPWMLVLSWGPPHDPYKPPREFMRKDPLPIQPNVPEGAATDRSERALPRYYGLIEAIDQEFGRLVDAIDDMGLADDTIIVYTSDHGCMLGGHGFEGKEVPYSDSTRVPFLMRWPGRIPAGSRLTTPFGTPDIFPTLAGLTGIGVPDGVDGMDFSAAFKGQGGPHPEGAYLVCHLSRFIPWPGWRGVRTERHLYARTKTQSTMVFDCLEDPYELNNLVATDLKLRDELDDLTLQLMHDLGDSWEIG